MGLKYFSRKLINVEMYCVQINHYQFILIIRKRQNKILLNSFKIIIFLKKFYLYYILFYLTNKLNFSVFLANFVYEWWLRQLGCN